jgi:hypothetical protein
MSRPKSIPVPINKGPIKVGKRVRVVHKGNNELVDGDEGTIVDIDKLPDSLGGNRQIWVRWENNFTLALIEGEDRFTVLD